MAGLQAILYRGKWRRGVARILYGLLLVMAFCSSFFIYLPGPTLPLASLGRAQAAGAWWLWFLGNPPTANAELTLPWRLREWPLTVGDWGWGLGLLLTPVAVVSVLSWLVLWGSVLLTTRQFRWLSLGRWLSYWLLIPLVLATGFWTGIYVKDWSYQYSISRAQPLMTALYRYKQEHGGFPISLNQLVPRYLVAIPTPGTLGAAGFQYHNYPVLCFSYPHASGLFPVYRVSYQPNILASANTTMPIGPNSGWIGTTGWIFERIP